MCTENNCKKRSIYGYEYKKPLYCSDHKKDCENVISKRCEYFECKKQPRFGIDKVKFCSEHKTEEMINLKEKLCEEKDCSTRPNYGYKNKKAIYCGKHKKKDMIDLKHKICEEDKCTTLANFGYVFRKATHCSKHKKDDMTDVTHIKCTENGCKLLPSYGYIKNKPTCCSAHKKDDMTIVTGLQCKLCVKTASYGYKKPEFCNAHKKDDMVDCKSKKCKFSNCKTRPLYGFEKPTHCSKHKEKDMKDLKTKKCEEQDCEIRASYGIDFPEYCSLHKKDKMTNLVDPKCVSCNLFIVPTKKSKCWYCKPPDEKHRRTKEYDLLEFLKSIDIPFEHNKSVGKVCGDFRPDFLFDANTHFVVVECDEEQHRQYDERCEVVRMYNIYQSLGLPVHFIRYNPDKFKLDGIDTSVSKLNRLKMLENVLIKNISIVPNIIDVTRLFYDSESGFVTVESNIKIPN